MELTRKKPRQATARSKGIYVIGKFSEFEQEGLTSIHEGTTFHLYLPAVNGMVDVKEEVETKPFVGRGRILVMDDEARVRGVVGRMLKKMGYDPVLAQDGTEALELYSQARNSGQPFAAVILDLTIPGGMGGKEVIHQLLAQNPEVKALVSSGYADDAVMANFIFLAIPISCSFGKIVRIPVYESMD